jgi:hypothetical protein
LETERYYEPLRHPAGRTRLRQRLIRARGPRANNGRPAAGKGLPSSRTDHPTVSAPSTAHFQALTASIAFALNSQTRLPLSRERANVTNAGIQFHVTDDRLLPAKGLSTLGFDTKRFPPTPPACYSVLTGTGPLPAGRCELISDRVNVKHDLRTLGTRVTHLAATGLAPST